MEKCSYCGADTRLFIGGIPVCVECEGRDNPAKVTASAKGPGDQAALAQTSLRGPDSAESLANQFISLTA